MSKNKAVDLADKELKELLKKHGKKLNYEFDFPKFRILPEEVLLAIKVLENNGLVVVIKLEDKK